MKKVALATCYFKNNYGSALQAYATQKFLDLNNIPNETIDVSKNKDFASGKKKYYAAQLFNFSFVKTKIGMIKFKFYKKINKNLGKNVAIRNKYFEEFKDVFRLSKPYATYDELNTYARGVSAVIVGSDQLWLPVNVVADYYTLNWCPEETSRISYSTSFGVSSIPSKYEKQYRHYLEKIGHLSVRELSGQKIIKEVANKESTIVCDPTLLLTKEQWDDFSYDKAIIEGDYIFCYFLGKNVEHRKFVERLKRETQCKIISINHCDEYVKYSDTFCDESPYDIGPKEWVNLIKNAKYVCTDSFHATVFSIIFNRTFFDFRRHSLKNKNSTNTRIDSILEMAGLPKERILNDPGADCKMLLSETIDWNAVNKNIEIFRLRSSNWLLASISNKEQK